MICWQLIFLQSKVNRGTYDGDRLPAQNWDWPQGTWFQNRLRYLRKRDQITHDDHRLDLKTASPRLPEYTLEKAAALKEFGNGMPTMFDRQRGQVPRLH
jgi:hypothetical protein